MGSWIFPEFGGLRMEGIFRTSPLISVRLRFSLGLPHSLRNVPTRWGKDVHRSTVFPTVYPTACSCAIHLSRLFKRPVYLSFYTKNSIITGRSSPMARLSFRNESKLVWIFGREVGRRRIRRGDVWLQR